MKITPLILAAAAVALSAQAQAESEKMKGYELKNRSAFHAPEDARIPFWPIGFVHPAKGATATAVSQVAKIRLEPAYFNLTSVMLGHPALATINGRAFAEGEVLPVVFGNERLKVVLRSVQDGGVTLDHEGQRIFVPMKRLELAPRQSQQQAQPTDFAIRIGPAIGK